MKHCVLMMVLALSACGSGDKTAAIDGITKLRDEMCACKDKACAETVYKKWGDVEKASEKARHDEDTKTAWNKIDDELVKCMTALTK